MLKSDFRNTVYRLKKTSSVPCTFCKLGTETTDRTTGVKTLDRQYINIQKGISLPKRSRIALTHLGVKTGGSFLISDKELIITYDDLQGLTPETSDYFIIGNKKYAIIEFTDYEPMPAYYFHVRRTQNELPYQVVNITVKQYNRNRQLILNPISDINGDWSQFTDIYLDQFTDDEWSNLL